MNYTVRSFRGGRSHTLRSHTLRSHTLRSHTLKGAGRLG